MDARLMAVCCVLNMGSLALMAQTGASGTARPPMTAAPIVRSNAVPRSPRSPSALRWNTWTLERHH